MICIKCKKEIQEESKFCNYCGAKQIREKSSKKYGNGHGTVYKDKNGKWIAEVTIGWDDEDGKLVRRKRKKRGFATKNEAIAYLPELKQSIPQQKADIKFKEFYEKWMEQHEKKVSKATINCYKSAFKYFSDVYYAEMVKLRTDHLQKCIDLCPHGTRTKENMKALGTSMWRYAMQLDLVEKNYAEFIYIRKEDTAERLAFSCDQLRIMWENAETVPGVKYILLLCYTGMRLGEMLGALTENYHPEKGYFIAGIKTAAGKNRVITISPKLMPFFDDFGKGKHLFYSMGENKFRNDVFYPALQALGMDMVDSDNCHLYTPHTCRHTFASLMKNVEAPSTDKQKLIGHAKFEMTAHYTHTDIESLRKITDNL